MSFPLGTVLSLLGNLDKRSALQQRSLPLKQINGRLEYLRASHAFVVSEGEENYEMVSLEEASSIPQFVLRAIHATTLQTLASCALPHEYFPTATLVVRGDTDDSELLIVAANSTDDDHCLLVYEMMMCDDDTDASDGGPCTHQTSNPDTHIMDDTDMDDVRNPLPPSSKSRWRLVCHGYAPMDAPVSSMTAKSEPNRRGCAFIVCGMVLKPQVRMYELQVDLDLARARTHLDKAIDALAHADADVQNAIEMLEKSEMGPIKLSLLGTTSSPHGGSVMSISCAGNAIFARENLAGVFVVNVDGGSGSGARGGDGSSGGTESHTNEDGGDALVLRVCAVDDCSTVFRNVLAVDGGESVLISEGLSYDDFKLNGGEMVLFTRESFEDDSPSRDNEQHQEASIHSPIRPPRPAPDPLIDGTITESLRPTFRLLPFQGEAVTAMCRGRLGMRLRIVQTPTDPAPSHDAAAAREEDVICVTNRGSVGALSFALPSALPSADSLT